jgi:O-antigen/teichoic acid export membrane protein
LSLLSTELITFLLGEKYYDSILFFKILILALPLIWTYNFIIGAYIIPKNQEKVVTNINFIITVSSLIFIPIFIYLFDLIGLSTYVVLIEFILFFRICIIIKQAMLKKT